MTKFLFTYLLLAGTIFSQQIDSTIIDSKDSLGNQSKKKIIGIKIAPLNNEFSREKLGPSKALFYAVKETWFVTKTSLNYIFSIFQGKGDSSQLGGPIRIAKITGQVAEYGFIAFLSITAYTVSYTHLTLPTSDLV